MKQAARQADVVVPVIAGDTIVQGQPWSPHTIRPEWSTKISSVLITRHDLVKDSRRLKLTAVARECEIPGRKDCILLCDTPQGMAAMQLQHLLDDIDRKYSDDPILSDATAKTDRRLGQEIKGIVPELTKKGGSFYRVGPPDRW